MLGREMRKNRRAGIDGMPVMRLQKMSLKSCPRCGGAVYDDGTERHCGWVDYGKRAPAEADKNYPVERGLQ